MARRSADPSCSPGRCAGGLRRSDRFLQGLHKARRVVFVSHIHPDPDSLGSMLGLAHLVQNRLGKPTVMTRDGPIARPENRAMVEVLKLDLKPIESVDWREDDAVVMVDSQPNTGRHSQPYTNRLYAVIDHHDTPGDVSGVPFVDIRSTHGATCTVVTRYLIEQQATIPERVATALLYGIETEMTGYPREAGPADDEALLFLYPLADKDRIAQIRSARLPQSHFGCLLQALQSSFIYDRLIISWVDDMPHPEHAAEIVDFMIRFDQVDWAVCGGVCGQKFVLSLRAALENARAGELLHQVVGDLGRAGGHDRRAGGCIPLSSTAPSAIDELKAQLRRRFLKALGIEECRGQRLVPLRNILQNLQS
jgi:nanoRNase/pAp phosphatase (c-di-AMP/oligoRNAs hydrolase)